MRVLVRAAALSVIILMSRQAAAAEPLRPRLVIRFGSEVGRPGEAVTVEVASLDGAGAPLDAAVTVDVEAGKATPPQRTGPGLYRSTLTVPTRLPASRTLLVLARAGALSADASLRLAPGPATTLRLEGPGSCSEDAEACRIDVIAADAYGNPAAEVPEANAELGRISAAGAAEPGRWVIIYHSPRVDREQTDRVTVEMGKLKAIHAMRLAPASTRLGIAPLLGAVSEKGHLGFTAGGQVLAEGAVGTGWLMGAGLEGSWWSVSHSAQAAGLDVKTDRSELAAAFFVQAERPLAGRTIATFSLGGGAVRVNGTAHVQGQPGVSDSGWAPMARGTAALGYRLGRAMPFLEFRGAWVGDAHLVTDPGAKWPLFLQLGFRLDVR